MMSDLKASSSSSKAASSRLRLPGVLSLTGVNKSCPSESYCFLWEYPSPLLPASDRVLNFFWRVFNFVLSSHSRTCGISVRKEFFEYNPFQRICRAGDDESLSSP